MSIIVHSNAHYVYRTVGNYRMVGNLQGFESLIDEYFRIFQWLQVLRSVSPTLVKVNVTLFKVYPMCLKLRM